MKIFTTILLLSLIIGSISAQQSKNETINKFLEGVLTLNEGDLNEHSPISSFNKIALEKCAKSIMLTKENMKSSIDEASNYKACIITVGTHTIVKIEDFTKSIKSGSWGCKLPYGGGYIMKGTFNFKEDYINNIIGIPDTQRRMMFLFK